MKSETFSGMTLTSRQSIGGSFWVVAVSSPNGLLLFETAPRSTEELAFKAAKLVIQIVQNCGAIYPENPIL